MLAKGKGKRAYSIKDRNEEWARVYKEAGGRTVEFLFRCDDEAVVFAYEAFMIKTDFIWGMPLTNKTHGGDGGRTCSPEVKERLRQINLGKHHTAATIAKMKLLWQDPNMRTRHQIATKAAMSNEELKKKHHEKQKGQYKPVIGTNIITGEKIYLEFTCQDPRFSPSSIRGCILGKNGRKQHKGYAWEYADKR